MSNRQHFEGLLGDYMKSLCRRPLKDGKKAIPEVKTTFREGFKAALIVLELIESSTTELGDDQMDIICSRLEELTGIVPPNREDL